MSKRKLLGKLANLFGAIAYLIIALQWLWVFATMAMPLTSTDAFQDYVMPPKQSDDVKTIDVDMSLPPFAQTVVVVLAVAFAIGVTVYAVFMMPRAISRTGRATIKKAATASVAQTTKHQKIKPKQKQALTVRYIWRIKLLAVILPAVLALIPPHANLDLAHDLVIIVALFLAGLSLINLGLQVAIAYAVKVPFKNLW